MSQMLHTPKQAEVMKLVLEAADEGRFISMQELKSRLSYGPDVTNQAILCSINFLVRHGMLSKVYGDLYEDYKQGLLLHLKPTPSAYSAFRKSL